MRHSPASATCVVLCLALGASLALPSTHALASAFAPSARQRSEQLLAEGDAAATAKRWDEAISKYRASYYGLPPADQAAYVGSLTVRKAMRAYQERIAAEQDPSQRTALLQRQRVLLEEFLAAVAGKPGAAKELGEDVIAELEETRRSIDAALAGPQPTEPDPNDETTTPTTTTDPGPNPNDPTTTPANTPSDRPEPSTKPPRDWLGLGLVIGGSVTLAAGLGVGAGRWVLRANAQQLVDAGGDAFAPGTPEREEYLEGEYARAQKFLIAGSVVAGVGLATTVAGVVHILVHRRRASTSSSATALHLAPALSPTTAGLVLHRRF